MALGIGRGKSVGDLVRHGMTAMIEPGAEIEGKLKVSSGSVRINSHFKGEISGDGTVLVAERGEVEADIAVKSVTVVGKVKGSIRAADRLEIRERGVVLGDITTPVLLVEPGGFFDGQCHMPSLSGEAPKSGATESEERTL